MRLIFILNQEYLISKLKKYIDKTSITLRQPIAKDGPAVFELIKECPPLDNNSMYCNLLQCTHFSSTSVAAYQGEKLVGFVSGYVMPDRPKTLFIWQIAIHESARGYGLASRLLNHLLMREVCLEINAIETTITESNAPSWALFDRLTHSLSAQSSKIALFEKEQHFNGQHETEYLLRITSKNSNKLLLNI